MTAQELIDNLRNTSLIGLQIAEVSAQNTATLLELVNMAKDKVAEDTLLWLGGEQITMVTDTYVYELSQIPVQIVDVYDDTNILRPRNQPDYFGYYQTSPNVLRFNNVSNDQVINVNYYETPTDYVITDEIVINSTLVSAMRYYITANAFNIYKADADIFTSDKYMKDYKDAIGEYKINSDSVDVDTIVSMVNKIWKRGIR